MMVSICEQHSHTVTSCLVMSESSPPQGIETCTYIHDVPLFHLWYLVNCDHDYAEPRQMHNDISELLNLLDLLCVLLSVTIFSYNDGLKTCLNVC